MSTVARRVVGSVAAVGIALSTAVVTGGVAEAAGPCHIDRTLDTAYFTCSEPGHTMTIECLGWSVGIGAVFFSDPQIGLIKQTGYIIPGRVERLSCNANVLRVGILTNATVFDSGFGWA